MTGAEAWKKGLRIRGQQSSETDALAEDEYQSEDVETCVAAGQRRRKWGASKVVASILLRRTRVSSILLTAASVETCDGFGSEEAGACKVVACTLLKRVCVSRRRGSWDYAETCGIGRGVGKVRQEVTSFLLGQTLV